MSTDIAAPPVLTTRQGSVLILTLNRPHRLNAITRDLLEALTGALHEAAGDEAVRAVLLTGAGRAFCSGLDLRDAASEGRTVDVRQELREYYRPAITSMRVLPKPILAAVNGPAAGAGFSLALAADLRIAGESATFVQAFVRIGLIPDAGSTYFLPRLVGPARAAELMMLGDTVDARQAEQIGLVTRVVPDSELLDVASGIAARLAEGPRSLAFIKEALQASADNDLSAQLQVEERLQEAAVGTSDFYEGIGAFLEKRAPRFTGR